jgi:hypothetical protein
MLQEYKYLSRKRLAHITGSTPNPGHFAVLVRSIPKSGNELLVDTIRNFFVNYHGASYLSHQMIYRKGKLQKFVVRILCGNGRHAFSHIAGTQIMYLHLPLYARLLFMFFIFRLTSNRSMYMPIVYFLLR